MNLCKIRRAMLDEIKINNMNSKWPEYHRLRKILANEQGISLNQADDQVRKCLPNGSLSNEEKTTNNCRSKFK